MKLREKINRTVEVKHPYLDITTVDLVEFYDTTENEKADLKNALIKYVIGAVIIVFAVNIADWIFSITGPATKDN